MVCSLALSADISEQTENVDDANNRLVGRAGVFRGANQAAANLIAQNALNTFGDAAVAGGNLTCENICPSWNDLAWETAIIIPAPDAGGTVTYSQSGNTLNFRVYDVANILSSTRFSAWVPSWYISDCGVVMRITISQDMTPVFITKIAGFVSVKLYEADQITIVQDYGENPLPQANGTTYFGFTTLASAGVAGRWFNFVITPKCGHLPSWGPLLWTLSASVDYAP